MVRRFRRDVTVIDIASSVMHNVHIATQTQTAMQDRVRQIVEKCNEVIARAQSQFQIDLSKVQVRFDLRGRAAGQATRINGVYSVRFNRDMLTRDAFDHVLNNTVPHEFAHIVCFMVPSLGRNHDRGWESVCRRLGGEPKRCHTEKVVYGKGTTYEYTTSTGHDVRISQQIHNRIQSGASYGFRGKGKVDMFSPHSIVGMHGRTLATPIIKQGPNAPATIEFYVKETQYKPAVQVPASPVAASFGSGTSKASVARAITLSGFRAGKNEDEIIACIMHANGQQKGMATAYYKDSMKRLNLQ